MGALLINKGADMSIENSDDDTSFYIVLLKKLCNLKTYSKYRLTY
jgi:hypothetical protein